MKKSIEKPYPCIESTIDIPFGQDKVIRIWKDENKVENMYYPNLILANRINDILKETEVYGIIIEKIAKEFKGINAIQIKGTKGIQHGVVAYLVDFNNDFHG